MRKRKEIEKDGIRPEFLILEVLLDIREMLQKQNKKIKHEKNIKEGGKK